MPWQYDRGSIPSLLPSDAPPSQGVNGHRDRACPRYIHKTAVVRDPAVAEKSGEKRQAVVGQTGIHKGLLPVEGFNGAATWLAIVVLAWIDKFFIEFCRCSQPQA